MNIPTALETDKFKHYLEIISELYKVDDDFKTMCDDYCLNRLNIEKLKRKCLQTRMHKMECEELSIELEDEIFEYIMNRH